MAEINDSERNKETVYGNMRLKRAKLWEKPDSTSFRGWFPVLRPDWRRSNADIESWMHNSPLSHWPEEKRDPISLLHQSMFDEILKPKFTSSDQIATQHTFPNKILPFSKSFFSRFKL